MDKDKVWLVLTPDQWQALREFGAVQADAFKQRPTFNKSRGEY